MPVTSAKNFDSPEQYTFTLGRSQLLTLVGQLPRCPLSIGLNGRKPKAEIPSKPMAEAVALIYGQYVYPCKQHWHCATPVDFCGSARKPDHLDAAYAEAVTHASKTGQRMYVYGTRTVRGRWRYRARPAVFRDWAQREGEL